MGTSEEGKLGINLGRPPAMWIASKEQNLSYSPIHSGVDYLGKPSRLREWFSWKRFKVDLLAWSTSSNSIKFWKPVTLRGPVLGSVVMISVAIIIALEILAHTSSLDGNSGGIVFAPSIDNISMATKFSYSYLPTILAVFFSMLWSWVDLDAKRLEPWFQLSKPEGALGTDSLLLQYPFDFLPFIPITAFRRKHWNVFLSSTVILIIFWVITPLQSAIFNIRTITRSRPTFMQNTAEIMPLEMHQNMLNSNFLNAAYGISSLGQRPPPFTTSEFALLSFKPSSTQLQSESQTWSTKTEIYSTSLDCEPAKIERSTGINVYSYVFDNGRGCKSSQPLSTRSSILLLYLGYFSDAVVDWSIGNPNCTIEHADNFLAIWASKGSKTESEEYAKMTALYCRPKYYVQDAIVTVNASDGRVASHQTIGPSRLLSTGIFNATHFEYVVGAGVPPVSQKANLPDIFRLEPYPSIAKYNLSWPTSNAVGFGVALNNETVQDLGDPEALHRAFDKAHKLLFATAFSFITRTLEPASSIAPRTGTIQELLGAVVLERKISLVVEASFGLVIIMALTLWYLTFRRPSRLMQDPGTISEIMALIQDIDLGEDLAEVSSRRFKLSSDRDNRGRVYLKAYSVEAVGSSRSTTCSSILRTGSFNEVLPIIRPLELRILFGLLFITIISVALGAVIFLDEYSSMRQGISLPSNNSTVISILENYLPTIFATLLEPAWVILNRILCLLQPFDELRRGHAEPSASIQAKYTSLPPQLTAWRALRSGHLLLAAVCLVTISTNILAVALSGLIEQRSTVVNFSMAGTQSQIAKLNDGGVVGDIANAVYLDHYYAAQSNLTTGTSLPPWVDTKRVYVPFEFESPRIETAAGVPLGLEGVLGSTTGFGAELSCYELSTDQNADNTFVVAPSNESLFITFETSHLLPNSTKALCRISSNTPSQDPSDLQTGNVTIGDSALEIAGQGDQDDGLFCSRLILAGWVRLGAADITSKSAFGNRKLSQRLLACRTELKVAAFDVLVTTEGRILRSKQTSNFTPVAEIAKHFSNLTKNDPLLVQTSDPFVYNGTNKLDALFWEINRNVFDLGSERNRWHNNSFTVDWINSLITYKMGNDSIVNPASPIPTYENARTLLSESYSLIFAILLGLNLHIFDKAPQNISVEVNVLATEQRIFLESTMFKITIILLSLQLIVAVLYYVYRPKRFLTSMPTSIASIVAFVQFSKALEDFRPGGTGGSSGGREQRGGEGDGEERYGFGRFVGTDGKTHVGIERSRLVVPLESVNPQVGKRGWWNGLRRRKGGKGKEAEVKVWI